MVNMIETTVQGLGARAAEYDGKRVTKHERHGRKERGFCRDCHEDTLRYNKRVMSTSEVFFSKLN